MSAASPLLSTYQKADKLMLPVLWLLFIVSLVLSSWHSTLLWSLVIGLPAAALPTLFIFIKPGQFITRASVAVALMVFSGLHIHQAAGMGEFHFGIFVSLAVLLCYTDWRVIVISAGVIAVHHLSFNYLQELGYGPICFTKTGLGIVLLHATYVVVEASLLSYLCVQMKKSILQGVELGNMVNDITKLRDNINLVANHHQESSLGKSMNHVVSTINKTLIDLQEKIDTMASSANEIAQGNNELLHSSMLQSDSLKKTTSSVDVLTDTVKKNSSNMIKASQLMQSTADNVLQGKDAMEQAISTMQSIKESSEKIVEIIGIIDTISFQTNILALNAAVEAAHAGEHGKGFAVVASEVRSLAQRSATAAKQIKALIDESVEKVNNGNTLVSNAGSSMNNIVESIYDVKVIMEEVSHEGQRQSHEIEDANKSLQEIDNMNHTNALLVKKAAQLSQVMQQQSQDLEEKMKMFTLK